jgi:threonine dehydratase
MSRIFSANVFVKHEQAQYGGSFKLRGVTNHLMSMSTKDRKKGVVTASTGNHGVAVAYASKILNVKSTIYLCDNVPQVKIQNIKDYGAKYEIIEGGWCIDAEIKAR